MFRVFWNCLHIFFSIFCVVLRPKLQFFKKNCRKLAKKRGKVQKRNPEGSAQKNPKSEETFSFFFLFIFGSTSKLSENVFWTSWDHLAAQKDEFLKRTQKKILSKVTPPCYLRGVIFTKINVLFFDFPGATKLFKLLFSRLLPWFGWKQARRHLRIMETLLLAPQDPIESLVSKSKIFTFQELSCS